MIVCSYEFTSSTVAIGNNLKRHLYDSNGYYLIFSEKSAWGRPVTLPICS